MYSIKCREERVYVYVRYRESCLRWLHNIISRYWLVCTIWSVADSLFVCTSVCGRKSECNSDRVGSNCNEHVLYTTLFASKVFPFVKLSIYFISTHQYLFLILYCFIQWPKYEEKQLKTYYLCACFCKQSLISTESYEDSSFVLKVFYYLCYVSFIFWFCT